MSEYVILRSFITQMNMNSGLFINIQHYLIEQGLPVLYFLSDCTLHICICPYKEYKSVGMLSGETAHKLRILTLFFIE